MQGRSLIPILNRRLHPTGARTSTIGITRTADTAYPGWGVVDGRYKLIHYYEEEIDEWELIDLQRDPNELRSFYNDPEYATIRTTLEKELERLEV